MAAFLLCAAPGGLPPTDQCFWSFTALSSDEPPVGLITGTYRELFQALGGFKLSPDTLERVVRGNDPFIFPETNDGDVYALNRKLKDFKEMIRGKGWPIDRINESLLAELGELAKGQRQGIERAVRIVGDTENGYPIDTVRGAVNASFHTDGRYLLLTSRTSVNPFAGQPQPPSHVEVYDLLARKKVDDQSIPQGIFATGKFLPGGEQAVFGDDRGKIQLVPFKNGRLDFTAATSVGTPFDERTQIQKIEISPNGKRLYGHHLNDDLFFYDLQKKTRVPIQFREYVGRMGARLLDWKVLPGTDRVVFLTAESNGHILHDVTVSADGTLHKFGTAGGVVWAEADKPKFGAPPERIKFDPAGKRAVAASWGSLTTFEVGKPVKAVKFSKPLDPSWDIIQDFALHPTKPEVVVAIENREHKTHRMEIIDLETGEGRPVAAQARNADKVTFSPDGNWVLVSDQYGGNARLVNFRGH